MPSNKNWNFGEFAEKCSIRVGKTLGFVVPWSGRAEISRIVVVETASRQLHENPLPPRLAQRSGRRQTDLPQRRWARSPESGVNDDDFNAAVRTAQAEYDLHCANVIVGSSRGGAVAMNIEGEDTPLVLLCPAWKNWGTATTVKSNTTILHSRPDDVFPFVDSEELVANSGLPPKTLIEVGNDHRPADPEPLKTMLEACKGE